MKQLLSLALAAACGIAFSACGGSTPAPAPKPAAPKPLVAPEPAKAPAAAPAAASSEAPKQPDTNVNPAPAGDAAKNFIGSTWSMPDGTELTVKDAKTIHAKGGVAAMLGPIGLDIAYTLSGDKIELSAMGQKKSGTFDGSKLTIDGNVATRK